MASLSDRTSGRGEYRADTGQTSELAWALEGDTTAFKKALNPTFDLYRSGEGDENLSPNNQSFRENTPESDSVLKDVVELPSGSWNKPYSPRSNPFGERPSQRTPGARSFVRRLSTHSSLSGGSVTNVMADAGGREEDNVWLSTPEVSLQEVKSSWDAVGRIERLLDDQVNTGVGLDASSLQTADMALTWTGTQISTRSPAEDSASWRQRVANTAFHGTPSPTSSRASSLSGGEALGSAGAQRRRSAPGASPLVQGTPQAVPEESGTPDSQSAETFPRSFRIQRSGSADSLASLLSHTSDITAREGSSFERERDALRERQMETIPEPGETPMRTAEGSPEDGCSRFARSADGVPVLATPRQERGAAADEAGSPSSTRSKQWLARTASEKWLDGHGTPRPVSTETLPAQKAEGAFASPIEVQETAEFTLPPPSAHAIALPAPVAKEALTPFVRLHEPATLTPIINAAHKSHSQGDRAKPVATPFARLRQPVQLTPVIKGAQKRHAQARALSGDGSNWSIIQGLLALATLAAVLLVPSLMALVPNFNGHILPSAPHKARHHSSSAGVFPRGHPWTDAQKLIWKPTEGGHQQGKPFSNMLNSILHHDGHGASFGLLRKPNVLPPTPHVDRLMGTVSSWWAQAAARLPSTVIDRLPQSMQPPKAKASSTLQKATDAGEAFMQKVVDTLLPKAEPVEEAARTGAVKPKTLGAPAPAPPTMAQTASAAQTKVTKQGNIHAEKAHRAAEAVREDTAKALPEAPAVPAQAAAKAKAGDALATSLEALQRAKSGAGETLEHMSRKLSEVAHKFGSTAAQQARQAAAPVQAAALRARSAAVRSAQRGADAVHTVMARAMQGASEQTQGILAAAAITLLLGILAGLLAVTVWPAQAVQAEPEQADELDCSPAPMATPVPLFTPRPVRRSHLGLTDMPTSPRTAAPQRATPALSMPAATPRPARSTARAARTAPVSSSKALDIILTADTPAARTRSRLRLAA